MGDDYRWEDASMNQKNDPRHNLVVRPVSDNALDEGVSGPVHTPSTGYARTSIIDSMVQICAPEFDREILRRKSYNVNMRLYRSSNSYRNIIESIAQHMLEAIGKVWYDYTVEKGVAAPVLGFPFRMIGVSLPMEYKPFVMINPRIIAVADTLVSGRTNCGAIRLKSLIEVKRPSWVSVRYYDLSGKQIVRDRILKTDGGHMIQHEIDHLDGILITDRFIQQGHTSDELSLLWPGIPGP